MRWIRFAILLSSALFAALLLAPPAWAATPVTFAGPTDFAVGDGPNSVTVGDFNGDGDPDLAVANQVTGAILVLRGTTGGGFTAPTTVGAATGPFSIAVGEFNGDGDPDLAVADPFSGRVLVLLGSAGATFTAPAAVASGSDPLSVAVGDFNGDGASPAAALLGR